MGTQHWTPTANYDAVPEDGTLAVATGGLDICLYKIDGVIFATDNKCTHGDADLSDGLILDSCLIECPLHEGTFDIRTGKAVGAPCTIGIQTHEARVESGVIYLKTIE